VIIFLDLVLHKYQVYRHILFNIEPYVDFGISIQYLKIFGIYLFFEAYSKWTLLKDRYGDDLNCNFAYEEVTIRPFERYGFIVLITAAEFLVFLLGIIAGVKLTLKTNNPDTVYSIIKYNYLVMAIILSSFGKGFVFLTMIWEYKDSFSLFRSIINIFVLTSNVLALQVFLDSTTIRAASLIALGIAAKLTLRLLVYASFPEMLFCISDFCL